MSDLDLEPIKARLDKAHTEWGPWKAKEDSWDGYSVVIDDNGSGVSIIAEQIGQGEDEGRGDAEFIAHAPEDMRALIAEVGRLTVEHLEMRIERDDLRERRDYYRKALMKADGEIEAAKAAVQRHPDVLECSEYGEDEPISCGWKSAYRDVVWALNGETKTPVATEILTDEMCDRLANYQHEACGCPGEEAAKAWLEQVKAEALREAAAEWTQGEWAGATRYHNRAADRLASAQYAGDWLRARADRMEAGEQ